VYTLPEPHKVAMRLVGHMQQLALCAPVRLDTMARPLRQRGGED
jgi:hypothetical protein